MKPTLHSTSGAADIAAYVCQSVAELDDRNSPADWPEAMLVTGDELHQIVTEALAASAPAAQPAMSNVVNAYCKAWEASFLADNPFHKVFMQKDDKKHILAGLSAALAATPDAAPARQPAGWLTVHDHGGGFYGGPLKSEAQALEYIYQVERSSDSVTLRARPFVWADVAPPAPNQQGQIVDIQQVIFALERARNDLQVQADRRHDNHDFSAEFPAEDAKRMNEAITLLRARPVSALVASAPVAVSACLAVAEELKPGDVRPIVVGGTLCADGRWWCEDLECYVDADDCEVLPVGSVSQNSANETNEQPDTDPTSKAQYRRMFQAACEALGEIGDALGCDPDMGGAQPILAAIAKKEAQAVKTVDDLATLVRRLANALRKAKPGHELPDRAMDYLKRKGLQGAPLRSQLGREGKMKKATVAVKTRDGGAIEIAGWQLACGAVVHRTPHRGVKWRVFYDDAWSVSDTVTGGTFAHGNSMADAVGRYRALVRQHGPDFEIELQARREEFMREWGKDQE